MFKIRATNTMPELHVVLREETPPATSDSDINLPTREELRRQMYERIAQGNALAEIEEIGRRRW